MSIGLLLPMALAALAALALPLLVHLVRRTQDTPVLFAALRWLRPAQQPRQRRRFDEWLLLALRLLLLALLALWLAQPVLRGHLDLRPWLLVVPGADPAAAPPLPAQAQRRWLAPGLPPLDGPPPRTDASLASLLREADATIPPGAPVTVLAPERITRTDAQRPRLSRTVDWRVSGGSQPDKPAPPPWRLAVRHDDAHAGALPYLHAVVAAWQAQAGGNRPPTLEIADPGTPLAEGATHAFWLAATPPPEAMLAWARAGGVLVLAADAPAPESPTDARVVLRGEDGQPLAEGSAAGAGRMLRLLVPLTPASMPALLEPEFPRALATSLRDGPPMAGHAHAADWPPLTGAAPREPSPMSLQPWLAWLLALLFGIERLLAMRAGRQVPA